MDLRQLRYFVAVAEELHFSRAAARLNLAQSALSAQIRQLEGEIGGQLLTRSTRRVDLTPAGAALLEDARDIIAAAEGAVERARALARGESGSLVIGVLGPAPGGLLAPVLERFGNRHQDVRVELRALPFTEITSALREHRVDLTFTYLPLDEPDLAVTPLLSEERVVVLPVSHRLAGRERLRPRDLRGETFVKQPDSVPNAWCDFWLLVDELGGRPLISPHTGDNVEEWLHLIGRGAGIDTAPAIVSRYYSWPDVTFIPLVDAAPSVFALASRQDTEDRLLQEFTALALDVAASAATSRVTPYQAPDAGPD